VAAEAGLGGLRADHPLARVTAREAFEPPTTRGGEGLAVLLHDAHDLAGALDQRVVLPDRFEEIEDDHRTVGERARPITLERLRVGVDVVDATERLVERVTRLDHHALDVLPSAPALGPGDLGRLDRGREGDGEPERGRDDPAHGLRPPNRRAVGAFARLRAPSSREVGGWTSGHLPVRYEPFGASC